MVSWVKNTNKWVIGFFVVFAFTFLLFFAASYAFSWTVAPWIGALEERQITTSGGFRIQAYEQFYRWQEDLESLEARLCFYEDGDLSKEESIEQRGLRGQYAIIVGKYNAASRAERTQGQWRAEDLPETVEHIESLIC